MKPGDPHLLRDDQLEPLCRLYQGKATCAFLVASRYGLSCAKSSVYEAHILDRWQRRTMNADGNHCQGPPTFALMTPEMIERARRGDQH